MADEDLTLKFGAQIDQLITAVNQVKSAISDVSTHAASMTSVLSSKGTELEGHFSQMRFALMGLTNPLRAVRENLGEIAELFLAAFAVEKIEHFVEQMTALNVQTERTAALLGTSTSNVSALDIAAKASGTSVESITFAFERLGPALARAETGTSQAAAALKAIGVSVKDFSAMDFDKKLQTLAEKFSVIKDGSDKDAIAIALLGRAGAAMIPTFNEGAESFKKFDEIAQRAGTKSFKEFEESAKTLHLQTIELSESFTGVGMSVLTVFQPALSGIYKIIIDLVEAFNNSVHSGGAMYVAMRALAITVSGLATTFSLLIAIVRSIWDIGVAAAREFAAAWQLAGRILKDAATFNFSDMGEAWTEFTTKIKDSTGTLTKDLHNNFQNAVNEINEAWGTGAEKHIKIEQTKNAKLDLMAKDRLSAAMAEIQNRIKLADMEYQAVTDRIKHEYGDFIFTQGAKTQALLVALDVRHKAEGDGIAEELRLNKAGSAAYQKILDEKKIFDAKYALDRQKIIEEAAKAEEKTWNQAFSDIQGAFNSQLRGLLAGTTTWAQATKAMLGDLVIKAIEYFEKMAFEWIAHEAVKTAGTTSATAARAAAEATGEATSLPGKIAAFTSDITADAARTFAGIFAFLSPFMGPAAAGPAAAGEATVAAQMAAVPKFDVGTNLVTKSGFAMIHENEAIVPAESNGAYTGGGGGVTVNIHAVDASSIRNMLLNNKAIVGEVIQRLARDNPSAFGKMAVA